MLDFQKVKTFWLLLAALKDTKLSQIRSSFILKQLSKAVQDFLRHDSASFSSSLSPSLVLSVTGWELRLTAARPADWAEMCGGKSEKGAGEVTWLVMVRGAVSWTDSARAFILISSDAVKHHAHSECCRGWETLSAPSPILALCLSKQQSWSFLYYYSVVDVHLIITFFILH